MKTKKSTKAWFTLPLLLAGLGLASTAQAGLFARPYGMVYDSDQNLTWLQDANYLGTKSGGDGTMDWAAANDWANNLKFAGNTGWRLPTADPSCLSDYNCTGNELGNLFYIGLGGTADTPITDSHNANFDLFINLQADKYWTQNAFVTDPNFAWNLDFFDGTQMAYKNDSGFLGWAVHVGDVTPISEPGSALLFLAGVLGWLGLGKRRVA